MRRILPNLSEQQICFCHEYLISFNAYRSAMNAGYSDNTARKGELLQMPKIQEYLRMKMQHRTERMEITHDMILREYAKVAFSNMANYYDEQGRMKPACELTESEMAAISFLQTKDIAEPDGYIIGDVIKIKLHNKMAALDRIAKHLGFFEGSGKKNQEARSRMQEDEGDEQEVFEGSGKKNQETRSRMQEGESEEPEAGSLKAKAFEEEVKAVVKQEADSLKTKTFEGVAVGGDAVAEYVVEVTSTFVDVNGDVAGLGAGVFEDEKIPTFSPRGGGGMGDDGAVEMRREAMLSAVLV